MLRKINKRINQRNEVKEQYIGECEYCKTINKLYDFECINPKFCMECGTRITYIKNTLKK